MISSLYSSVVCHCKVSFDVCDKQTDGQAIRRTTTSLKTLFSLSGGGIITFSLGIGFSVTFWHAAACYSRIYAFIKPLKSIHGLRFVVRMLTSDYKRYKP